MWLPVCVTEHNRRAARAKSARQEPSQGQYPRSCRADCTGLLINKSPGWQSRCDGARGMGSSSGLRRFGNVELGLRLSGLRICKIFLTPKILTFDIWLSPGYNLKSGLDPLTIVSLAAHITSDIRAANSVRGNYSST